MDATAARALGALHVAPFSERRWRHTVSVVRRARDLSLGLSDEDRALIEAAAWLHDLGYAPAVAAVGFHPLDGARFLRTQGWRQDICDLVAHHSCADVEADRRGAGEALREEFADRPGPVRDVLWGADATIGPAGERLSVDERVREVLSRYGAGSLVAECMVAIAPQLAAALARVEVRLVHEAAQPT